MAIYGDTFTFDGISCEDYELMLYDREGHNRDAHAYGGTVSIIEEKVLSKNKPLFYGATFDKKLEFQLIFGLNIDRIDANNALSTDESNDIASWLIGHTQYKYLQIDSDDYANIRFKCIITGLEEIVYGERAWAMKANVVCDGPYAYRPPTVSRFVIQGHKTIDLFNSSGCNGYYYPIIEYRPVSGGDLIITNVSDNGRKTEFVDIPSSVQRITVNNDTLVITNNIGINLYDKFNKKSVRLKKGINTIDISGNGELIFYCEYPINIAG